MNKEHQINYYRRIAKNFMTPDVIEFQLTTDGRIIELSKGTGIGNEPIWGVTEFDTDLKTTRRGQMHTSAKSARKHFNTLCGAW